jgi:hypothetical protein
MRTTHFDQECRMLADRHYSRQTPGAAQFCGNGEKIVLRDAQGLVLFVWLYEKQERWDGRRGIQCQWFRNESSRLSSEIIREAETFAVERWGMGLAFTFVDSTKIKSVHPGYCFRMAGWDFVRDQETDRPLLTSRGKHVLEKRLDMTPFPEVLQIAERV